MKYRLFDPSAEHKDPVTGKTNRSYLLAVKGGPRGRGVYWTWDQPLAMLMTAEQVGETLLAINDEAPECDEGDAFGLEMVP